MHRRTSSQPADSGVVQHQQQQQHESNKIPTQTDHEQTPKLNKLISRNQAKLLTLISLLVVCVVIGIVYTRLDVNSVDFLLKNTSETTPHKINVFKIQYTEHSEGFTFNTSTKGSELIALLEKAVMNAGNSWKGYTLAEDDLKMAQKHKLTYGEMTYDSLDSIFYAMVSDNDLLANCSHESNETMTCDMSISSESNRTFMDLGSGTGKISIQAFLSGLFSQSYGIEVTQTRFTMGCYALSILSEQSPTFFKHLPEGSEVVFVLGDFLKPGLIESSNYFYTCSTCFSNELMESVLHRIDSLQYAAKIATLRLFRDDMFGPNIKGLWQPPVELSTPSTWSQNTKTHVYSKLATHLFPMKKTQFPPEDSTYCRLRVGSSGKVRFSSTQVDFVKK